MNKIKPRNRKEDLNFKNFNSWFRKTRATSSANTFNILMDVIGLKGRNDAIKGATGLYVNGFSNFSRAERSPRKYLV